MTANVGGVPRRLLVALALLAALGVLSWGVVLEYWEPGGFLTGDYLSVYTGLVSAGCCLYAAALTRGTMRLSWVLFALVMGMYAGGDILWLIFDGGYGPYGDAPIVTLADLLYVGAFLPMIGGLLVYPVLRGARGLWKPLALDAMVLVAAVLFLSYTLVLDEVFASSHSDVDSFMLAVYPVTDVLIACLVAILLLRSVGQPRIDVLLTGLTFALYCASDNGYALMTVRGEDSLGTVVDLGYAVAPLVMAAAALVAATTATPRRTYRTHLNGVVARLIPDLAALSAVAVVVATHPDSIASRVLGLATVALAGIRQLVQTSVSQGLRARLERQVNERTRELAELQEHYRRLEAMKYQFVTSVSHELRTPLTAIRGSLEMLHDGDAGELPDSARPVVAMAVRGSQRLTRLVNDIIDLERLESGGFAHDPARHDVGALIEEAAESMLPLARDRGIRIRLDTVEAHADCDADRVVQVLVNLVGNALKFSPAGSTVTVSAVRAGDEVRVSVRDAGRGVPPHEAELIFERFHQIEADDSREKGGAGLGLTISRLIVERHGGRIWVEDGGPGATFTFTLPVEPAAAPAPAPQGPHARAGAS